VKRNSSDRRLSARTPKNENKGLNPDHKPVGGGSTERARKDSISRAKKRGYGEGYWKKKPGRKAEITTENG